MLNLLMSELRIVQLQSTITLRKMSPKRYFRVFNEFRVFQFLLTVLYCVSSQHVPLHAVLYHTILCDMMYDIVAGQRSIVEVRLTLFAAMASSTHFLGRDLQ